MSLTDGAVRFAACTNVANCSKAANGETLDWYPGAGEYCPECGEALSAAHSEAPAANEPPPQEAAASGPVAPRAAARSILVPSRPVRRKAGSASWAWIVAGLVIAGALAFFFERRLAVDRPPSTAVRICPIPSAQQLAADLVRAYENKSAAPAGAFSLKAGGGCDVRFSTAAESPDAVIARDGIVAIVNPLNPISRISESQLRALYSGRIRDWSQLGGPPGAIVPILPDAASDEGKVLASSLLFGVAIDRAVRRGGGSAEVTRTVTGPDSTGRRAIGIVTFSQSVAAKVVPLAYLPTPNVLSIASGLYPYTLSIAVASAARSNAAAQGLVAYARSRDGAAIVVKNGLIPREGF